MPIDSQNIIISVRRELKKYDKPEFKHNYQRFHKEKLKDPIGLKTGIVRKISGQIFRELKGQPKNDILNVCNDILKADERYFRFFAFDWAGKISKDFEKSDFSRFECWLQNYVGNWGQCDHLSCDVLGMLVLKFPELVAKTKRWTKAKNLWERRSSAVTLIMPVRKKGILLDEIFKTADILMMDPEDLVQKGYGWMLKEASNVYPDEVFGYVMKHKDKMPRTALRYAIEKLPQKKRKEAMQR